MPTNGKEVKVVEEEEPEVWETPRRELTKSTNNLIFPLSSIADTTLHPNCRSRTSENNCYAH